jgi:Tol biopolymer transport system component
VSSAGVAGDDAATAAAVSGDGRFVAFWSLASTLVAGDTNGTTDVFVRDRQTQTTERISVDSRERQSVGGDAGGALDTNLGRPAVSGDGRFVAFASSATNLVKGDRNQAADIFLRDRLAGTTERLSVTGRTGEANSESSGPVISPDGVFVRDRAAQTTVRASVRTDGTETGLELGSFGASLSTDGQVVAFESEGALVAEDSEFPVDVFVHDEVA